MKWPAHSVPDVQEGESLLDFERRVFDAWVNYDKFVGRDDTGGILLCWRRTRSVLESRDRRTISGLRTRLLGGILRWLR